MTLEQNNSIVSYSRLQAQKSFSSSKNFQNNCSSKLKLMHNSKYQIRNTKKCNFSSVSIRFVSISNKQKAEMAFERPLHKTTNDNNYFLLLCRNISIGISILFSHSSDLSLHISFCLHACTGQRSL